MRKTTARMLAAALLTCILTVASGEEAAVRSYAGEYMSQYEFAEETRARLKEETGR